MRLLRRTQPFHRSDRGTHGGDWRHTSADGPVTDVHGAGAALGQAAAELRPVEVELAAEDIEEWRVGGGIDGVLPSVHGDLQLARHDRIPSPGGWWAKLYPDRGRHA